MKECGAVRCGAQKLSKWSLHWPVQSGGGLASCWAGVPHWPVQSGGGLDWRWADVPLRGENVGVAPCLVQGQEPPERARGAFSPSRLTN